MEETVAEQTNSFFDLSALGDKLLGLATEVGGKLLGAILLLIFGGLFIRLLVKGLRKSKLFKKSDATVAHFLVNFIKIALDIVLIVTVIGILGVPMSSVVAVIASAGVAVGLALQGSLSNLAGGIMILIFRPFKLGNYISAVGYEGTVKDIGIFYTVLTTVDNKEVTIPNGTIMGTSIVNFSAYDLRRVDLTFNVAYGTDVAHVNELILAKAKEHALTLDDPAPFCRLSAHHDSSLEITLRVWCKNCDYWQVNFDLKENINNLFIENGVKIPFNQLDVHLVDKKD